MDKHEIKYSVAFTLTFAAAMSLEVKESRSIVAIAMTGAGTLNLSADATPSVGDEITLKVSSDGTARDLTFGTGFTAPVLSGVINKTKVITLVYDGSKFIPKGAAIQID